VILYFWSRRRHPFLLALIGLLYAGVAIMYWRYSVPVLAGVALVIFAVYRSHKHRETQGARTLAELYLLSPEHFEHRVMAILEANGWEKLRWVGGTRDMGADITGVDPAGRYAIVQAKRYRPDVPLGSPVVQSLLGSRTIYGAEHCVLVTTARFTHHARSLAAAMDVELVGGVELAAMAGREKAVA
jgi:HJR/Mrr/RecB family endonuclease